MSIESFIREIESRQKTEIESFEKELRSITIPESDSTTNDLLKSKNQDIDRISREISVSKIIYYH